MEKLIRDFLVLQSGTDFVFKVLYPTHPVKGGIHSDISQLLIDLEQINFNKSDIILFRTKDNRMGVIGEEFTSWYPETPSVLGIKMINDLTVSKIELLNMKPGKGGGFGTIKLLPMSEALIIFFMQGNERNWDYNFKKIDRIMDKLTSYLDCKNLEIKVGYNA